MANIDVFFYCVVWCPERHVKWYRGIVKHNYLLMSWYLSRLITELTRGFQHRCSFLFVQILTLIYFNLISPSPSPPLQQTAN